MTRFLVPGKGTVPLSHRLPGDYLAISPFLFDPAGQPRPLGPHPSRSTVGRGGSGCVMGSSPWSLGPTSFLLPLNSVSSMCPGHPWEGPGCPPAWEGRQLYPDDGFLPWSCWPGPLLISYSLRSASPRPTLPACLQAVLWASLAAPAPWPNGDPHSPAFCTLGQLYPHPFQSLGLPQFPHLRS